MELGLGLESLLNAAPLGVVAVNGRGFIVMANRKTTEMFGYGPGELTNQSISVLIPADLSGRHAKHFEIFFEDPKPREMGTGMVLQGTRKNGTSFPIEVGLGHWSQESGGLAIAFIADITGRKNAEESQRLTTKWGLIGLTAGSVAHDFNNLFTVVRGYLSLIADQFGDNQPLVKYVTEALNATDRMIGLNTELLSLCRNESPTMQVIDLNEILASMTGILGILAGKPVKLETYLEAPKAAMFGDGNQMQQLLMNLVANARDAMPQGGTLTIRLSTKNGSLVLEVTDTGEGMSQETQDRIFEPFFTTKEIGHGTGLGLVAVHSIVTAHRGRIEVASKLGRGTTFSLAFPQMQE